MARKAAAKNKPGLPKGLAQALIERKQGADSELLLNEIIEAWGGARRIARDIVAEFQKAAVGGMTRQRIIEMVLRLVINNTNHEIGRMERPSDMSDEELEAVALSYVKRVTADGPSAPAAGE